MANKLVLVFNNGAGDYTQKYISDTFADIANLPIDIFPSSKTYCLENKKQYILDLNKNWVEYKDIMEGASSGISEEIFNAALLEKADINHTHDTATTTTDGMMSSADKTSLEVLTNLLGPDSDSVVNKIDELLDIFENYPEGDKMVQALAGKSDNNHTHSQYVAKRDSSAGAIPPSGELYGVSSAGQPAMFRIYSLIAPSSAIVKTNSAGKLLDEVLPANIPRKDAEGYLPVKTPTSEAEISTHLGVAASYYYVKQVDAALRELIHNRDNNIILSYPAGTSANNFAIKSIVPVMMHPSYMQSFADLPSGSSSLFTGIVLTVGDPEAGFKIQLAIARAGHIYTRMCSPNAYAQMTWSNWCSTEKEYATTETAGVVKVGEGIELADNAISVIHASQEYSIEWADAITLKTNKIGTITINGATTISKEDAIAGYSCTWGINIIEEETAYPITFADEINWDAGIAPAFSANSITQVWLYYKGPMLCGTWS